MALLARAEQYTDKDFDSLRLRLQDLARSVFPEWTDFSVASFGNILLELYAFVGDLVAFYQDNQARESRIATATQRKNLIALAKLIGFRPAGARAATADVVLTLAATPEAPVTIPQGTRVRTASITEPVFFQLLGEVVIPAGASPPARIGTVEHSEPEEERFASSGLANQEVVLPATPFLDDSAVVSAANGDYAEVPNFLGSTTADRHFTLVVDQSDRASLRFGNGVNGAIPAGTIVVRYKTGGGAAGNVNAGTLTTLEGSFTDEHGRPVTVAVTNPQPASGGTERQTPAQIRVLAPESIRVLNRSVTREDFEINARRLPEVARALMLTSDEDPAVADNRGLLFIIPRGGGLPSQALKDAVLRQVTEVYPCMLTFQVEVRDPVYLPVDVQATVHLREGANPATVSAAILRALGDFFAVALPDGTLNPTVDFGWNLRDAEGHVAGEVTVSDILDVIHDVPGVRKIGDGLGDFLLNAQRADVRLGPRAFPTLGQVTLLGPTGAPL